VIGVQRGEIELKRAGDGQKIRVSAAEQVTVRAGLPLRVEPIAPLQQGPR
jgi:hypothetical protein